MKRSREATRRAAVKEYLAGNDTKRAVAARHQISVQTLANWVRAAAADQAPSAARAASVEALATALIGPPDAAPRKPQSIASDDRAELARLRLENARLRVLVQTLIELQVKAE